MNDKVSEHAPSATGADAATMTAGGPFEYDAFISYRRRDAAALAGWIRNRLQRFKLPREIVQILPAEKKELHARKPRIWLDKAYEKPSDDFLTKKIYPALDRSARLIVVLTPSVFDTIRGRDGAQEPNWLVREIDRFLGDGKVPVSPRPLDLVLGTGGSEDRFPGRLAERDRWDWIDLRAFTRWRSRGLSEDLDAGITKLVAGLYEIPDNRLPALRREERRRRNRLVLGIASVATAVAVVISALGVIAWRQRGEAIRQSRMALSRQLAAQAQLAIVQRSDGLAAGAQLAVQALTLSEELGIRSLEAEQVLRTALPLLPVPLATLQPRDNANKIVFTPDSKRVITLGGRLTIYNLADLANQKGVFASDLLGAYGADAFSRDRRYLARAYNDGSRSDGTLTAGVWEVATGRHIRTVKHEAYLSDVALSADGKYLATASFDRTARVWNVETGDEVLRLSHDAEVLKVAFSPDDQNLATVSQDNTAHVWRFQSGRPLAHLEHKGMVRQVAFSSDSVRVATAGDDGLARVWNSRTGDIIEVGQPDGDVIWDVAFSPDNIHVATAGNDGTYRVWDVARAEGREIARLDNGAPAGVVAFSPDGNYLIGGTRVWDWRTRREVARTTWAATFSPDGRYLAAASNGPKARVWRWPSETPLLRLEQSHTGESVDGSPAAPYLTTGGPSGGIWDLARRQKLASFEAGKVAFSRTGSQLAGSLIEGGAFVMNVGAGKPFCTVPYPWAQPVGGAAEVIATALSADGLYLAVLSSDPDVDVGLWDTKACRRLAQLGHEKGQERTEGLAFSPDGKMLLTAVHGEKYVHLWEIPSGREVARLEHEAVVSAIALSSDGRFVATASGGGVIRTWDAVTHRLIDSRVHAPLIRALAVSPNGEYVVSGALGGTAKVFATKGLHEIAQLQHARGVRVAKFSSDGAYLATGGDDGLAHVWEAGSWRELARMTNDVPVWDVAFVASDQYLATASGDAPARGGERVLTTRVWAWKARDMIADACARLPDWLDCARAQQ